MQQVTEAQALEVKKRGVNQVATVFRRGVDHGQNVGDMYLPKTVNTTGLSDNLRALIDVWEAQESGTLGQPAPDNQPTMTSPIPDYLGMVARFHHRFGSPVLVVPALPDADRQALRLSLLTEELDELREALAKNDLVAVADALCDLQYVLAGTVLEVGMARLFPLLFAEVHRSNMSKACPTEEEAKATVAQYSEAGEPCFYKPADGQFLVYRQRDLKTLKGINYSPADLASLLEMSTACHE